MWPGRRPNTLRASLRALKMVQTSVSDGGNEPGAASAPAASIDSFINAMVCLRRPFGPQLPCLFPKFCSGKGNKNPSTESVTLDRFAGGCYIMCANRMMRALQGKLWGALFFLVFAFLLCSRYSVWLGLGPRAALILPLFEDLQKRCLRALFEPSAEFWVVLLGDLDGDRFLIDYQRSYRATVPIFDDGR